MFQSARLKLTFWYLLILMSISLIFSLVIFLNVSGQIENFARSHNQRLRSFQDIPNNSFNRPRMMMPYITLDDLIKQRYTLITSLGMINLMILLVAGGLSYFLAGHTLRPIQTMVEEQNQFISDASHELRTPIATLKAETEGRLLEKSFSPTSTRKLLNSNLEEINRLQTLTDRLLAVSQIHQDSNNHHFQPTAISLKKVIQTSLHHLEPLIKKHQLSIELKLSEAKISGDVHRLTEVFTILIDNAIKYSPASSTLIISMKTQANQVIVTLKDQGIGIASQDLPHIFERFYRADKSRSQTKGFGLGLSIAKAIVDLHHGSITAQSQPGNGSIFTLTFPLLSSPKS